MVGFLSSTRWGSQMCHAFAEPPSRKQEDTRGHDSEPNRVQEDTGARGDMGGHDVRRVRDREAPGSNPGPPTSF
jgi:hypothetical protein